jgi:hypothetical protein
MLVNDLRPTFDAKQANNIATFSWAFTISVVTLKWPTQLTYHKA